VTVLPLEKITKRPFKGDNQRDRHKADCSVLHKGRCVRDFVENGSMMPQI
jgi:hypothetical protein